MSATHHNVTRAGFTVLEMMLALVLLTIVTVKAYGVLSMAGRTAGQGTREVVLEDQAQEVLRRIAYAVMGANRETLVPEVAAPLSADDLRFQVNLGVQDGEVVWSDMEEVAFEETASQVYWSENPDTEEERRVVWSNLVAPYLQGELPNGMDDNGNGLIDEKGLSFVVDRDSVKIRLTLERVADDGSLMTRTVDTTVTCRNVPMEE